MKKIKDNNQEKALAALDKIIADYTSKRWLLETPSDKLQNHLSESKRLVTELHDLDLKQDAQDYKDLDQLGAMVTKYTARIKEIKEEDDLAIKEAKGTNKKPFLNEAGEAIALAKKIEGFSAKIKAIKEYHGIQL